MRASELRCLRILCATSVCLCGELFRAILTTETNSKAPELIRGANPGRIGLLKNENDPRIYTKRHLKKSLLRVISWIAFLLSSAISLLKLFFSGLLGSRFQMVQWS